MATRHSNWKLCLAHAPDAALGVLSSFSQILMQMALFCIQKDHRGIKKTGIILGVFSDKRQLSASERVTPIESATEQE